MGVFLRTASLTVSFVGVFSLAISSAFAAGNIEYHLNKSANPNDDELDAYKRIQTVMDSAVFLYNKYSDLTKHIEVYYSTGVPTAEASSNGDLRFGKDRSYMFVGTAMHEMAHTLGMGTTSAYQSMMSGGVFKGQKAQAVLKEIDGPDAELHGDSQHFWPYGLNYKSEVHSEQDLINHVKIVNAMYQDIFKEAFYKNVKFMSAVGPDFKCMGMTSDNALQLMDCKEKGTEIKLYSVGENPVAYRFEFGKRVLDVPNESTSAGVTLGTYHWNGGDHQKFILEGVQVNMVNAFHLKNLKSSLYLEAKDGKVVQNRKGNGDAFVWQMNEIKSDSAKNDSLTFIKRVIERRRAVPTEAKPAGLFDVLGRTAEKIRRGFSARILKRD